MKVEKQLEELILIADQVGFKVRKEKGDFRGGFCIKNEEELILLNKRHSVDVQLKVLAECLRTVDFGNVFMKPTLRNVLDDLWASKTDTSSIDLGESVADS